jgi:hypothetical protein
MREPAHVSGNHVLGGSRKVSVIHCAAHCATYGLNRSHSKRWTKEGVKKLNLENSFEFHMHNDGDGAGCRNRTRDIQFTKLALYQLS